MALFVDGPASTPGDLARIDAGLLDAAAAHDIDVTARLDFAHETLASDIQLWLNRGLDRSGPVNVWAGRAGRRLEQVLMNEALRKWEQMQALALTYRDAYFADLAERYRVRWDEYSRQSRDAYERFLAGGLAMVNDPVRKAAPPVLGTIAGPQSGGTFYACVAWVNAAGQLGEASAATSLDVPDRNIMTVTAVGKPANAAGFHVYAGTALNALTKRTDVAVDAGGRFLFIPGSAGSGDLPPTGQKAEFVRPLPRTIPRG